MYHTHIDRQISIQLYINGYHRSALFFLMLLSLGLGSQIGIIEGLTSTLFDHPKLHKVEEQETCRNTQ